MARVKPAVGQVAVVDRPTLFGLNREIVWGIVFLRVAHGLWFGYHEFYEKINHWTSETLPMILGSWSGATPGMNPPAYRWYRTVLENIAVPNAEFFRWLVTSWEGVLAVCLILGLGIRIVAPLQIFANINYILAKTYASPGANIDRLTIMILITLFAVSAGRYYGQDRRGYLLRRAPSWL